MRITIVLVTLALVFALGVMGQAPNQPKPLNENKSSPPPPSPSANGAHEMTAADVESFLDGIVPLQLKRNDIAGATVAVVKDGKLLFAKGYGYADVKNKKPVSADETLFRPGSISKLFTWTAIMQLYEQGKTRPRSRHQRLPRLQNSRRVWQAHHVEKRNDAYSGIRGAD